MNHPRTTETNRTVRLAALALALVLSPAVAAALGEDTEILYDGLDYFTIESGGMRILDRDPTIEERRDVLYVQMPTARGNGRLVSRDESVTSRWKVGFVQVLAESSSRMDYGIGRTEWKQPILPVNDSDDSEYPWYSGPDGWERGRGVMHLWFSDNPSSTITWRYTFTDGGIRETAPLRGMIREQRFLVYLCALDEEADRLHVIKTWEWSFRLALAVDVGKPLGRRCSIFDYDKDFRETESPLPLEAAWLLPPCANNAQEFVEQYEPRKVDADNGNN